MSEKHAARPARIALVQQGELGDDPAENLTGLLAQIDAFGEEGVDFIMPTELSLTPYFCMVRDRKLLEWAETLDGSAVKQVADAAKRHHATIIFPICLDARDGTYEDVAIVIGPDGNLVRGRTSDDQECNYFSKVHLPWSREGRGIDERFYFSSGSQFPVFDTPLARIGILICYDRRFPEAWRSLVLSGAEIIFVPACVPVWNPAAAASSANMFVIELQTRACENAVFVAACDRAGEQCFHEIVTSFVGRSCIIGPGGAVLEQAPGDSRAMVSAEIDLDQVRATRTRLTVLEDRRPETYSHVNAVLP